jgi:hypothetical protein
VTSCLVMFDTCDMYRLGVKTSRCVDNTITQPINKKQISFFYNASTCFGLRVSHPRSKCKTKIIYAEDFFTVVPCMLLQLFL